MERNTTMAKKPDAAFTERTIMALVTAVADRKHDDVAVIVKALAKEHGIKMPRAA